MLALRREVCECWLRTGSVHPRRHRPSVVRLRTGAVTRRNGVFHLAESESRRGRMS